MNFFHRKLIICSSLGFFVSWLVADIVQAALPYATVPGVSPTVAFSPWLPSVVTYYFSSSFPLPSNEYRARVRESAQTWTSAGSTLRYQEVATPTLSAKGQGSINWETIPAQLGGILILQGKASFICFIGESRCPSRFKVSLNLSAPAQFQSAAGVTTSWSASTTNIPAQKKIDLKSIATHELGHVLGLDHTNLPIIKPSGNYCNRFITVPNNPTMCDGYNLGEAYQRSLAPDDVNPFNGLKSLY